jgi:hypothetical protein
MGFVSTLKTPARRKEFKALGIDIDSATQKGAFADPFDIIRQSLAKTGGDPEAMKKLFSNVVPERAVTALTNTYNKAGGGDKGMAAINEMLGRFSGSVTDAVLNENVRRAMNTKGSKAQIQQNQIDERWAELSNRVLPALEKLAPKALEAVDAFATLIEWVSQNTGTAIAAAIGGSIAKAAIGPMIAGAIGKALESSAVGSAVSGGLSKALGGLGAGGIVAGVTIAAATVYLAAKDFVEKSDRAESETANFVNKGGADLVAKARAQLAATGSVDKDTLNELAMQRANLEGIRNVDQTARGGEKLGWVASAWASLTESDENKQRMAEAEGQLAFGAQNKAEVEALVAKMDAVLQAVKDSKQKGPIDVNIVGGAVAAGGAGRQGIGDQGT